MKKNISVIINLLIINITLFSCYNISSSKDKTNNTIQDQQDNVESVLNFNLVSESDLLDLGISSDLVDKILANQPFLNFSKLILLLDTHNKEELFKKVFLPLNLNTANESDFQMIPGVGKKIAHVFIEYRPYSSIEEFNREIGKYVDDSEVVRYLNTSKESDIKILPGIGDKIAHEFIEYRPYKNIKQFRRELSKYVDKKELKRLERFIYLK